MRLTIGDSWPDDVPDLALVVTMDVRGGALNVTLAVRDDDLKKREAVAESPVVFDEDAFHDVLGRLSLRPKVLFANAMAPYFVPEIRSPRSHG